MLVIVVLVVVVSVTHALAGVAVATVVGGGLTALAVKLFDKIEFHPEQEITFGAPLVSVPWLYSAAVSILLLYGTRLFADLALHFTGPTAANPSCSGATVAILMLVDWSSFAVGGWLIGRVFPSRALGLASLALVVLFVEWWLAVDGLTPERFGRIYECLFGAKPLDSEISSAQQGFREGAVVGLVLRGALAIFLARLGSGRSIRASSA